MDTQSPPPPPSHTHIHTHTHTHKQRKQKNTTILFSGNKFQSVVPTATLVSKTLNYVHLTTLTSMTTMPIQEPPAPPAIQFFPLTPLYLMAEVSWAVLSVREPEASSVSSSGDTPITFFSFIMSASIDLYSASSDWTASATSGKGFPLWVHQNLSSAWRSYVLA